MAMTAKQSIAELKRLGTAQTRKIYLRHGATEPLFGVKFGDLSKLKKKIGIDHEVAQDLWQTTNCDAQTLALMVADPEQIKSSDIDSWLRPLSYDLLVGMLAELTSKTSYAAAKWKKWSRSKSEMTLVAAYSLLSNWLKNDANDVPKATISEALKTIETGIHDAPNLARQAMNNALIAIGVFREDFRERTYKAAKKIGKVEVDHGETNCKTPDAESYIKKAVSHNRKRAHC